jgi:hypothetical protein
MKFSGRFRQANSHERRALLHPKCPCHSPINRRVIPAEKILRLSFLLGFLLLAIRRNLLLVVLVPPGEQPRKKGTAPSEMPLPFPDAKKTTVPKVAQTKDNKLWMATVFKWWGVVVGVLIGESSPLRRS